MKNKIIIFPFLFFNFILKFVMSVDTFKCFLSDEQIIKTPDIIKNDYLMVHDAFSTEKVQENNILRECLNYEIFQIKKNNELVASVYLRKCKYYSKVETIFKTYIKEEDGVEMYSLFVNDKYKGQGYARKLLYNAFDMVKKHYNMANDFIIGLHLNEADKFMNISFALYYYMNFSKGTFVENGPSDLIPNFHNYFKCKNPLFIVKNPNICNNKGNYFGMFSRYCNLLPFNPIRNKKTKDIGEQLRKILKNRKSKK